MTNQISSYNSILEHWHTYICRLTLNVGFYNLNTILVIIWQSINNNPKNTSNFSNITINYIIHKYNRIYERLQLFSGYGQNSRWWDKIYLNVQYGLCNYRRYVFVVFRKVVELIHLKISGKHFNSLTWTVSALIKYFIFVNV